MRIRESDLKSVSTCARFHRASGRNEFWISLFPGAPATRTKLWIRNCDTDAIYSNPAWLSRKKMDNWRSCGSGIWFLEVLSGWIRWQCWFIL